MKIYEWSHVDRWGEVNTIQVSALRVSSARRKAIEHLEHNNGNKYLLQKVKNEEPKTYEKGINVIQELDCETTIINTF